MSWIQSWRSHADEGRAVGTSAMNPKLKKYIEAVETRDRVIQKLKDEINAQRSSLNTLRSTSEQDQRRSQEVIDQLAQERDRQAEIIATLTERQDSPTIVPPPAIKFPSKLLHELGNPFATGFWFFLGTFVAALLVSIAIAAFWMLMVVAGLVTAAQMG